MRIVIRPFAEPEVEIDVTHRMIAAIAEALWVERGGNDVVNWLEAERHLARLLGRGLVEGPHLLEPGRSERGIEDRAMGAEAAVRAGARAAEEEARAGEAARADAAACAVEGAGVEVAVKSGRARRV
ncbi:MAG: DUF2934 domain-containing protein [Phycisphaerales bacterium]|nr:DUF2934 domain-containing protein [Phycisphaerales bacterium]